MAAAGSRGRSLSSRAASNGVPLDARIRRAREASFGEAPRRLNPVELRGGRFEQEEFDERWPTWNPCMCMGGQRGRLGSALIFVVSGLALLAASANAHPQLQLVHLLEGSQLQLFRNRGGRHLVSFTHYLQEGGPHLRNAQGGRIVYLIEVVCNLVEGGPLWLREKFSIANTGLPGIFLLLLHNGNGACPLRGIGQGLQIV